MDKSLHIDQLLKRYPPLSGLKDELYQAAEMLIHSYETGGKLLICGNGGSAADADHMVGELMKGFEDIRTISALLKANLQKVSKEYGSYLSVHLQQGLPAISLAAHSALNTAVANDIEGDLVFAQQVTGYGNSGDVLLGISTSGNSKSVLYALIVARAKGLTTIGFSGDNKGCISEYCDVLIRVPEKRTAWVQEYHLPIYHTLCLLVEDYFFKKNTKKEKLCIRQKLDL